MKLLLLGLLAICAAAYATEVAAPSNDGAVVLRMEQTAGELMALPVNDDLETAKKALEAVKNFVDIFNSDIFKAFPKVYIVAQIVSKVLSFIISIINLIAGIGPQESAEMKFMREQFKEVHAKLDSISLQLDEVKRLIEWQTTRVTYANYESFIVATTHLLDSYVSANDALTREVHKRQFITAFQKNPIAALKLYQAVVETDLTISDNLGVAVVHYTQNHRRNVMNFLLAMQRLIMRGAQLEIAYEKMVHGDHAATVTQALWDTRMEKLLTRMQQVENQVLSKTLSQMTTDIDRVILDNRHLSNQDFSGFMYRFLADKFDRRYWISVAYQDVSGGDKHWVSYCGGDVRFRTHGGRNVVLASSDPASSRFSIARGNAALDAAQREGSGNHAESWTNLIRSKIGNSCADAAFVGSICWGCNVWFTMRSDRYVYRKMSNRGDINTIVFG